MLQLLYPQHDLAEMGVGPHVGLRGLGLGERKDPVDRQAQPARVERAPQIFAHALGDRPYLFAAASAKGDAKVLDAAQRMQVEIERAAHAAKAADVDDASANGGRFLRGVEDIS